MTDHHRYIAERHAKVDGRCQRHAGVGDVHLPGLRKPNIPNFKVLIFLTENPSFQAAAITVPNKL